MNNVVATARKISGGTHIRSNKPIKVRRKKGVYHVTFQHCGTKFSSRHKVTTITTKKKPFFRRTTGSRIEGTVMHSPAEKKTTNLRKQ